MYTFLGLKLKLFGFHRHCRWFFELRSGITRKTRRGETFVAPRRVPIPLSGKTLPEGFFRFLSEYFIVPNPFFSSVSIGIFPSRSFGNAYRRFSAIRKNLSCKRKKNREKNELFYSFFRLSVSLLFFVIIAAGAGFPTAATYVNAFQTAGFSAFVMTALRNAASDCLVVFHKNYLL